VKTRRGQFKPLRINTANSRRSKLERGRSHGEGSPKREQTWKHGEAVLTVLWRNAGKPSQNEARTRANKVGSTVKGQRTRCEAATTQVFEAAAKSVFAQRGEFKARQSKVFGRPTGFDMTAKGVNTTTNHDDTTAKVVGATAKAGRGSSD
jgi:hypothetical protein